MLLTGLGVFAVVAALGGLSVVRVYDNQLIRQTESELLAQGVAVAEAYRAELHRRVERPADYGVAQLERPEATGSGLEPYLPSLRADDAMPPPAPALPATIAADGDARAAGLALTPLLREVSRHTLAGIRITDSAGVVVAASHDEALGTSVGEREEIQRALRGVPASLLRERAPDVGERSLSSLSRDSAVRVSVAVPVIEPPEPSGRRAAGASEPGTPAANGRVWGVVLLVRTPLTLAKAVYGDRWNLTATALVLFAVVALVSLGMSAFVVRPIRALVRQTRSIGAGEQPAVISRPVVQELSELSTSLSTMAQLLEQRAAYIRNFTASVSHEFKTPLSSIRGAVELLSDADAQLTPAQRMKFLRNVAADAERLTRLVERLLVLARAEVGSPALADTEVAPVLQGLAKRWAEQGLVIALEGNGQGDAAPLGVAVPADVLDAALNHLVENARLHAGPSVKVSVRASRAARSVELDVRDDGPGISIANRPRVFDAFFTTAREHGGTGLGLTISHALVRAFHGSLTLVEHDGPGAWFRFTLPSW